MGSMGFELGVQVCPNGHYAPLRVSYMLCSIKRKPFCGKCGEATLTACGACGSEVDEFDFVGNKFDVTGFTPPAFCSDCGAAFPWTQRRQRAAVDLFAEETQDQADRQEFQESVEQIAMDTPQAEVASRRVTRLLKKIGEGAAQAIRDILVSVASDVAKKGLMP